MQARAFYASRLVIFVWCVMQFGRAHTIFPGNRPKPAQITEVVVFNWTHLTFFWEKDRNPTYFSTVTSWWKFENDTDFRQCIYCVCDLAFGCRNNTDCRQIKDEYNVENGSCVVELNNLVWNETLHIKVSVSNLVGQEDTPTLSFKVYQKVKLDVVHDLEATALVPHQLSVSMTLPLFYDELVCNVSYISEWNDQGQIVVHSAEGEIWETIALDGLTPYTEYNVSVACKSTLGEHWSETVTVWNRTLPTVPLGVPAITNGSYSIRRAQTTRDITIYWQHVPQKLLQGPMGNYRVKYITAGRLKTRIVPGHILNFTIEHQKLDEECQVFVDVSTSEGFNITAGLDVITIPTARPDSSGRVEAIVLADGDHTVTVSWTSRVKHVLSYKVFWCQHHNTNTCQSELKWSKLLGSTTTWHKVNLMNYKYTLFRFGIGVELKSGNQGIQWIEYQYDTRNYPESPTIVDVTDVTAFDFKLWLRRPFCQHCGYDVAYHITWCYQPGVEGFSCPEGSPTKISAARNVRGVDITGLNQNSKYLVEVVSNSSTGLQSFKPAARTVTTVQAPREWSAGQIAGVVIFCSLVFGFAVLGVVVICRKLNEVRKSWFATPTVVLTEPPTDPEVNLESTALDSQTHIVYTPLSREVAIEHSSSSGEDDIILEPRVKPDGQSVVVEMNPRNYTKCHYTLPSHVQRKIRRLRRKPHQVYVDPPAVDLTTDGAKMKEKESSQVKTRKKRSCEAQLSSQAKAGVGLRVEKSETDVLLAGSQVLSDPPEGQVEVHSTLTWLEPDNAECYHDVKTASKCTDNPIAPSQLVFDSPRDLPMSIPPKTEKNADVRACTQSRRDSPETLRPGSEVSGSQDNETSAAVDDSVEGSDWSSSEEEGDNGYKVRATQIEEKIFGDEDSDSAATSDSDYSEPPDVEAKQ